MDYRLFRHPKVEQDLIHIAQMIGDYAGKEIAHRKLDQIQKSLRGLMENPFQGTIRNEIAPGLRVIPTARKGVITFTVDEEQKEIFIVSITYAGANWYKRIVERTG